jgi:membrane dipeptidase
MPSPTANWRQSKAVSRGTTFMGSTSARELVATMNRLGILIDITHGTEAVHMQLIAASRAPVVASHETLRAVSGVGISDEVLKALAAKAGLIGIGGAAAIVGKRYRKWMAENPEKAANGAKAAAGISAVLCTSTR